MRSPGHVRRAGWDVTLSWLVALWIGHCDCSLEPVIESLGRRRHARVGWHPLFIVGFILLQCTVPAAAALDVDSVLRVRHLLGGVSSHLAVEFLAAAASSVSAAAAAAAAAVPHTGLAGRGLPGAAGAATATWWRRGGERPDTSAEEEPGDLVATGWGAARHFREDGVRPDTSAEEEPGDLVATGWGAARHFREGAGFAGRLALDADAGWRLVALGS